jgi:hypothetical protein
MAFNTTTLQNEIKAAFDKVSDKDKAPAELRLEMATAVAAAIEKYVKAIKVASSIPVSTTGSAAAQTGFTTAQGILI